MKLSIIFFLVFMTVTFTNSAEINSEKQKSKKECKTVTLEADSYSENESEGKIEQSKEEAACQGNDSQCPVQTGGRAALGPSSALPQQSELEILEHIPATPNYFYGLRPFQRSYDWNGQWERIVNVPELNSAPYNGIQYYAQYAHPPLFPAYRHSSMYLPPAVPTYARRSIPELHRQIYRRPARVIRSRGEEDLLAELQHMAMMNNILPTMPIPFVRSSYGDVPYEDSSLGGASAVFPASVSNCALPLLFSCSPKITRGVLAKPIPADYSKPQWSDSVKEHLKQTLNDGFVIEDKSDSSQNDDSSSASVELADNHGNGNYVKGPTINAIDRALKPKHVGGENVKIPNKKPIDNTLSVAHVTS